MPKRRRAQGVPERSDVAPVRLRAGRSAPAAAAFVVAGLIVLYMVARQAGAPASAPERAPEGVALSFDEIPLARFTDVTAAAGITFVHQNGAYGERLLPETMGGGVAFFDYDGDGAPDLLFVDSGSWPWHRPPGTPPSALRLYRNRGDGTFEDVSARSGLEADLYGMGVAVGDYDNDGWVDVFVTGVGGNRLFHNRGDGTFADVTAEAGLGGTEGDWGTSAAWVDYDGDGRLDLFVANYVRWSREIDLAIDYRLPGIGRAYGPPVNFPGSFPSLFRNRGDGRFENATAVAGLEVRNPATGAPMAKSLGVAPVDVDGDGWIDFVVANDTVQNFVFRNRRDGTFEEIGARTGIAFDIHGQTRGAMGVDAAPFRNDDALGIVIGNYANEMNAFYVSQRDQLIFADEAIREGLGAASQRLLKFGLFFFDYDLDGRLDVLTANGHVEPEIARVDETQAYRQPAQLFWNRPPGAKPAFAPVPPEKAGGDLFQPVVGRGSAYADIDGDGDLDVVLTQIGGPPLLLRNDQRLGHHWVRFKLVGTRSNRDAIGAWIRLRAGGRTLSRQVMPTRGYLSQSELPVTFGLGEDSRVESAEIRWPSGLRQTVEGIRVDGLNVITEAPGG